jgi:hypothetical protein
MPPYPPPAADELILEANPGRLRVVLASVLQGEKGDPATNMVYTTTETLPAVGYIVDIPVAALTPGTPAPSLRRPDHQRFHQRPRAGRRR